jgi:hypothetical protein
MKITRNLIAKKPTLKMLAIMAGLLGYLVISFRYRNGMGDFGDFVKAGKMIWEDTDPYSNLMYVNSPVSATMAYGLSEVFPFLFFPLFWQLLNIAGLYFFIKSIVKPDFHGALPLVFACLAFLNVTRALFGNVQVTGLVLGLIAIGFKAARVNQSAFRVMLPIWLAVEVKPQLALGFVLLILFQRKVHKARILSLAFLIFLSHFIVELKFTGNINFLWIVKVIKYSSASLKEGFEISIWKSIAIYSGQGGVVRIVSILCIIATFVVLVLFSISGKQNWSILISILFPFLNTYLHLYDLLPIGTLAILGLYANRSIPMVLVFSIFLQFFPLGLTSQALVGAIIIATSIYIRRREISKTMYSIIIAVTLLSAFASYHLLSSESQELQIANLVVLPAMILLFVHRRKFVNLLNARVLG